MQSGSVLTATAAAGFTAGAVTLVAQDTDPRGFDLPIDYSAKSVTLALAGATIRGGQITISAVASDAPAGVEVPAKADAVLSDFFYAINKIAPVAEAYSPVDLSVILRGADASVSVDGSTIVGSGDVTVTSTTTVKTKVDAITQTVAGSSGVQVAAGFGEATTNVTTAVTGSTITAGGSILLSSTGTLTNDVSASAAYTDTSQNTTTRSIALASGYTNLVSHATVDSASTLTASGGSINVLATGTGKTTPSAKVSAASDGTAGVTISVDYDASDIEATLNGQAHAAGAVVSGNPLHFDGGSSGAVVSASNTFHVTGNGLVDGQLVTYDSGNLLGGIVQAGSGKAVGGLVDGQSYYVHVVDADDFQLTQAPALALDASADSATSNQTFSKVSDAVFSLDAIDAGQHSIRVDGHGFTDGDTVVYSVNNGVAINGLVNGASYTVHVLDDSNIQLLQGGQVVAISQGSGIGDQTFIDGADAQTITLARYDAANNAIYLPNHSIPDRAAANYAALNSDGSGVIGGLATGTGYTIHALNGNEFQFLDASGNVVAISDPGVASVQDVLFVAQVFTFNPTTTVVNSTTNTITLTGANLQNGDELIYGTDPSVVRTLPINVQDDGARQAQQTVTAGDEEIGGLENGTAYYAVRVDANTIRLVDSLSSASAALPIAITPGSGNYHTLTSNPLASNGIGVVATDTDKGTSSAASSGAARSAEQLSKFKLGVSAAFPALGALFKPSSAKLVGAPTVVDEAGNTVSANSNRLDLAGALSVNITDHQVQALVGNDTAHATALTTTKDVTVAATLEQKTQSVAQANAIKNDSSDGSSGAAAFNINLNTNHAIATLGGGVASDAGGTTTVSTTVSYPLLNEAVDATAGLPANLKDLGAYKALLLLYKNTLGIGNELLNNWSVTTATANGASGKAVSGSVSVANYDNESEATIGAGAQVNQTVSYQDAAQAVVVKATTDMLLVNLAGEGKWSTSLTKPAQEIAGGISKPSKIKQDLTSTGNTSSSMSLGGSFLVGLLTDVTTATVGSGAALRATTLDVEADEDITRIDLSQSGGVVGGDAGKLAFAGSGLAWVQNSTTTATLAGSVTGNPAVTVTATTSGLQAGAAGALVQDGGGATGIGISVVINDITRDTEAVVGTEEDEAAGSNGIAASSLTMKATTGGVFVAAAVAGTINSASTDPSSIPGLPAGDAGGEDATANVKTPPQISTEKPSGKAGVGIDGSAVVDVIADTARATVNTTGTLKAPGAVDVEAANNRIEVVVSGAVAIAASKGTSSGAKQFAGAFAVTQDTDDTEARVAGATLNDGTGTFTVQATRTGEMFNVTAGLAADTTPNGRDIAGSVSVNREVETVAAVVDSVFRPESAQTGPRKD